MTTLGVVARLLVAVGQTLLRDADGPGQPAKVKRKVKLSTEGVEGVSSELVEPPIAEATTVELRNADGPGQPAKVKRKVKPSAEGVEGVNWEDLVEPCPIAEATRAAELLQVARQKLGATEAQARFGREKQTVLRGPDGKKRRVCKTGLPRGQAWRLRE